MSYTAEKFEQDEMIERVLTGGKERALNHSENKSLRLIKSFGRWERNISFITLLSVEVEKHPGVSNIKQEQLNHIERPKLHRNRWQLIKIKIR